MSKLGELRRRLSMLVNRKKLSHEMHEEMRLHRELKQRRLVADGLDAEEARYAANRAFGNTTTLGERGQEAWGWRWLQDFMQDLRFGARTLRKNPGFTSVAVATLALGIGANTAIFSLVHAVTLRSLPVTHPGELYRLGDNGNCCVWGGFQRDFGIFSHPLYRHLRDASPEFAQMAAFEANPVKFGARRSGAAMSAESLVGEFVSGNYFSTFGVSAFAGRVLAPTDDIRGAAPAVVISYRVWKEHYGLDPSIVDGQLIINGIPFAVAGITPPGFYGETLRSDPPDLFLPLAQEPIVRGQGSLLGHGELHWLYIIGRLKPDFEPGRVQAKLVVQLHQWLTDQAGSSLSAEGRADIARVTLGLVRAGAGVTSLRDRSRKALELLGVVAAMVLIIACANIANLVLARGATNGRQTSVRLAVGASQARVMRQALTESLLLSLLGGIAGVCVAFVGTQSILSLAFRGSRFVPISASPSLPVLGFAFLASVTTAIIFGIAPALSASRLDPAEALRGSNRSTRDRSSLPQKSLVVLQASVSVVLLVGAGLLIRSLAKLEGQPFGFEARGRLIVTVNPSLAGYTPERLPRLYREIQARLTALPGVLSVAYSMDSPMYGDRWVNGVYFEDGRSRAKSAEKEDYAVWNRVSPRYFETIGTPLLEGRPIEEQDTPTARRIAVVNEAFARRYLENHDPVGEHIGAEGNQYRGVYEIVGVVRDAKYGFAREPTEPMVFLPFFQKVDHQDVELVSAETSTNYLECIEMQIAGRPETLEPTLRLAMSSIDPNLPITEITTLEEQVSRNFNQERLIAQLTGLFGLLALVLACVGLYGVTAYGVAQRKREIGLRMALGAERNHVVKMVVSGAMAQIGLGLLAGIPIALGGAHALAHELFGVKSYDPVVFVAATATLGLSGMAAGLLPAMRAASIDPMEALRVE
jgi:predicted permease